MWAGETYTASDWQAQHGEAYDLDPDRWSVDGDGIGGVSPTLLISNPADTNYGVDKRWNLSGMGLAAQQDEVYLRYSIYLRPGFQFSRPGGSGGGKWPGVAGKADGTVFDLAWGGSRPEDSWSARLLFGSGGEAGVYLYAIEPVGDNYPFGFAAWFHPEGSPDFMYFVEGWNEVQFHYKMNTPGVSDGRLRGWVNGELGIDLGNVQYRSVDFPDLGVSLILCNTGYGGDSTAYPAEDETLHLSRFELLVP